jgi:hypothetical protein
MRQPILLVALLFALTVSATAQQKEAPACTVRILLLNQNWEDHSKTRELMSPDQTKWWLEDGQKKFKNFCFVSASKPYDYRLVWTDTNTFRTVFVPTTTTTNGTVEAGGRTGTYSETSTSSNGRQATRRTSYVQIQLFKADAEADSTPLFNQLHKGDWVWSKPDRQALENALKALDKLTRPRK